MEFDTLESKEQYRIRLHNFEGPLDLLLFLIRREEIDIYDIPIATITSQYMEYVELMRELDLEIAGEFIFMAATLIQIKVRMLLPRTEEEGEEVEEDPRAELVRQLLEYKRYKEVAESMSDLETQQRRQFPRQFFDWTKKYKKTVDVTDEEFMRDVTLFDLLSAFKDVLENMPKITSHQIGVVGVTIEEQIEFLIQTVAEKERIGFRELMKELKERVAVIVTFMAILECIRTHRISIQQADIFGEIWITKY